MRVFQTLGLVIGLGVAVCIHAAATPSPQALVPFTFNTFPVGTVQASGWLNDQLQLSASGLGGNLYNFYRYVKGSTWLGGTQEYSELHESAPYWFNYIVPLAFVTGNPTLKSQAAYFLNYTLNHQQSDGWLGPETTAASRGLWARALLLFGLTQYAEADPTQTTRIVNAIHKYVNLTDTMLRNNYQGLIPHSGDTFDTQGYGVTRAHEYPMSLEWLYDNYPNGNQAVILDAISRMFSGGIAGGKDWTTYFVPGVFPTGIPTKFYNGGFTHGVNLAEGLRWMTVWYRQTRNQSLATTTATAVSLLQNYHTSLAGSIIADEHMGDLNPGRGSETCTTVESMFSYAWLYRFYGINDYADYAEKAAFNALPGALQTDWWAHQYQQQTNQPWSKLMSASPFYDNGPYANVFGLEPQYPCCLVNHPQGYPKFVASSYGRDGNGGIAHLLLGPTHVQTQINNHSVAVNCTTNYPFAQMLNYTITADTAFNFSVRIPGCVNASSSAPTVSINGSQATTIAPSSSNLYSVSIPRGTTALDITLPFALRVVSRNGAVAIYYGPLLYALDIPYTSTAQSPKIFYSDTTPLGSGDITSQCHDYDLEPQNSSGWQYAINADPSTMVVTHLTGAWYGAALPNPVWDRTNPTTTITVQGYPITWGQNNGTAAPPPTNPSVNAAQKTSLRLIPFASAKLHIAQFPVANLK